MKNNLLKIISLLGLVMLAVSCSDDESFQPSFYECSLPFTDSSQLHGSVTEYQVLLDKITGSGVPGIMMAVQTDAEGLWLGTSGKADLKSDISLQSCNMTRVGSTVKTFTADGTITRPTAG
jgi:D-alanyl-D-alanine carboxypeptidase